MSLRSIVKISNTNIQCVKEMVSGYCNYIFKYKAKQRLVRLLSVVYFGTVYEKVAMNDQ